MWSVLGFQGAVLSHILEPIFLDGILVSSRSRASSLSSTLIKYSHLVRDPMHEVSFPLVYGVASPPRTCYPNFRRGSLGHLMSLNERSFCTNWISVLDSTELVYSDTGATVNGKPSRLCKSCLFDSFANLSFARSLPKMVWSTFQPVYPLSYAKVKAMAYPYQIEKDKLVERLRRPGMTSRHLSANFHAFEPK